MEILHPVSTVKLSTGDVTVNELNWRDAVAFLEHLAKTTGGFLNEQGQFTPSANNIAALVKDSSELTEELILKSTGKDPDWLNKQRLADVLAVLEAALALNLSPELIARGKALGERLAGAFTASTSPRSPE